VMIPSFLDSQRCSTTVLEAFWHASAPDLLRFHIVDQLDKGMSSCLEHVRSRASEADWSMLQHIIEEVQMDASTSCGPVPARAILAEMIQTVEGSDFVLGIDSHMHFFKNWDANLKKDFMSIGSDLSIISAYPISHDTVVEDTMHEDPGATSVFNGFYFHGKMPRMRESYLRDEAEVTKVYGFAAGFNFMKARAWQEVPPDAKLERIFDGEEMHTYLRLWTRGYDTYSPSHSILSHEYSPASAVEKSRQFAWTSNNCNYSEAAERLARFFSNSDYKVDQKYRLGTVRTLAEFEALTGSNFKAFSPKQ